MPKWYDMTLHLIIKQSFADEADRWWWLKVYFALGTSVVTPSLVYDGYHGDETITPINMSGA